MELLMKFQTDSEKETEAVGEKLGRLLKPGDIVTLNGELGAGKTCFTSGAAKALGIRDYINSPTFTIVNEYRSGESLLYHFDLYRIASYEELLDIGFEEYAEHDAVLFIEWAERVPEIKKYYKQRITDVGLSRRDDISPTRREIEIRRYAE